MPQQTPSRVSPSDQPTREHSRRSILKLGSLAGAGLLFAPVIASCAGPKTAASTPTAGATASGGTMSIVLNRNLVSLDNKLNQYDAAVTVQGLGGDFWKFHDLAFANQKELTPENFEKWAVQAGVDAQKFKAAYDSKKYAAKVDKDLALSRQLGARGTPAFRINGKTLSGAQPFEKFKEKIDRALKGS